jgi:hypothetical protein
MNCKWLPCLCLRRAAGMTASIGSFCWRAPQFLPVSLWLPSRAAERLPALRSERRERFF